MISYGKVQAKSKIWRKTSLFGGAWRGSNLPIHWKKLQSAPDDAPRSSKLFPTTSRGHNTSILNILARILTQHVLYFWKAWDSRISNMTFPCIKCEIHKYTNTKCLKDPTCAIFLKSIGFKDIEYNTPVYQMWNTQIRKYTNTRIQSAKSSKKILARGRLPPFLAMPGFWVLMYPQPTPNRDIVFFKLTGVDNGIHLNIVWNTDISG